MRANPLGILRHFLSFKREQWYERDDFEKLQRKKLERLLHSASRTDHYSFLSPHLISEAVSDLSVLPITTKEMLRDNGSLFINKSAPRESLFSIKTSGSSGMPTEIFLDRHTIEWRIASGFAVTTEFGRSPSDILVEILNRGHTPHPLLQAARIYRMVPLSKFDGDEHNYSRLRSLKANLLGRNPTNLIAIARLNDESPDPLKLKSVYCTAELLTSQARKILSDSFSCPVFDHYGATEAGSLAFECPEEHRLHVSSSSIIEILDSKGKPKKSGVGQIALTPLENHAMPFMRYLVGDRASWGKECPCGRGFPVLKALEGRTEDMIRLPGGRETSPRFLDLLWGVRDVLMYQIVQESEDSFLFFYCSRQPISRESMEFVISLLERGCRIKGLRVSFERVESIAQDPGGKIRTFMTRVR
jgi:phenylacetate-CoA ligase